MKDERLIGKMIEIFGMLSNAAESCDRCYGGHSWAQEGWIRSMENPARYRERKT